MIYLQKLAFLVLLIKVVIASRQCAHTTNQKIQECVHPVAQYARILNQQEIANTSRQTQRNEFGQAISLPKLGGEVFKELCRLIKRFDECVFEYRQLCPKHITINLIDASYGFLCNEGYDTFMSSAECLMELDQKPSVKYCHDETLADIERANHEFGITMPLKLDRMCEALNFFSGCVRLPIRHNCGVSAWSVIFRVLRDTTKTLMPGCQFTGQSPSFANRRRTTFAAPQTNPSKPPPLIATTTETESVPKNIRPKFLEEDRADERPDERVLSVKAYDQSREKSSRQSQVRNPALSHTNGNDDGGEDDDGGGAYGYGGGGAGRRTTDKQNPRSTPPPAQHMFIAADNQCRHSTPLSSALLLGGAIVATFFCQLLASSSVW